MKRNLKKAVCLVAALSMIPAVSFNVSAKDDFYSQLSQMVQDNWRNDYVGNIELQISSPKMNIDGVMKNVDPEVGGEATVPVIINDRTMLPIRAIVEELGGEVGYNSATGLVEIKMDDVELTMKQGQDTINVNGETIQMDTAPVVLNDRTMVPVRAITENLLCTVEWVQDSQSVIIKKEYQTMRIMVEGNVSASDYNSFNPKAVVEGDDFTLIQFSTMEDAKACCEYLRTLPNVISAEPDLYIPPIFEEDGTGAMSVSSANSWGVDYIGAAKYAQSLVDSGVKGKVKVAVIDTGVDASHPFLAGKVGKGYDFINCDDDAYDDNGHGTHVAGTIVDCMPGLDVEIIPVKVLNASGSGTSSTVAAGIQYAADINAEVANLSLGGAAGSCSTKDKVIESAVKSGVAFAFAAGNESTDVKVRCMGHLDIDGAVVVAANDSNGIAASFSNFGATVDVAAPGVNIKSCVPGGSYATWNGTSMATPHVAACLAMIKLANPSFTPAQIQDEFEKTYTTNCEPYSGGKYSGELFDMTKLMGDVPPTPTPGEKTIAEYKWVINGETNPKSVTMKVGETLDVKFVVVFSDKTEKDVTSEASLEIDDEKIAKFDSSYKLTAVDTGKTELAYGFLPDATIKVPDYVEVVVEEDAAELKEYKWRVNGVDNPENVTVNVGETAKIEFVAVYKNKKGEVVEEKNVIADAAVESDDTSIATIGKDGVLTGIAGGKTSLYYGHLPVTVKIPDELEVTVVNPVPKKMVALEFSVDSVELSAGGSTKIEILAVYDDGSKEDVTADCKPYSKDEKVVTITENGEITAVGAGSTKIWMDYAPQPGIKVPRQLNVTVK